MRETRELKKSPAILKASNINNLTNDKLELRANNSFTYSSNIRGKQKIVIYAGTFDRKKDTLMLHFHNQHKDSLWTGIAVINEVSRQITFLSKYPSANLVMTW
jgi:hypothetical protein